jgi:outer membrane murein-binding lipoprotein Lpp
MRALILASLMVAGLASAESPQVDPPPADTVTLTRAQMDELESQLEALVRRREQAAFEAGRRDAKQRCASLI